MVEGDCMYSYALLESGCYYLIQEKEESPVSLDQSNGRNRLLPVCDQLCRSAGAGMEKENRPHLRYTGTAE